MADTFQTGGSHPPGKNTNAADGTVIPIGLEFVSPYGADPTKLTFANESPMNSDEVGPQPVKIGK